MIDRIKTILLNLWKGSGITLDKIGTVLIDRRFWIVVLSVLASAFGLPKLVEHREELSQTLVQVASLIINAIVLLVGMFKLIDSWTVRPPSGTQYRESAQIAQVVKFLKDNGIEL